MISIDYDTAEAMVKQLYPAAKNPMLSIELELTRGVINYRPYLTACKFLLTEYRQIVKADEVTFAYNREETIRGLLNRQKELDTGDTIPAGQTVDDVLVELCATCAVTGTISNYLGVNIF
jgi:hypothetical protein